MWKGTKGGWRTTRIPFRLYAHQGPIQIPLEAEMRQDGTVAIGAVQSKITELVMRPERITSETPTEFVIRHDL